MMWLGFPEPPRCAARGQVATAGSGRAHDLYPAHNTEPGEGQR